MSDPVLPQRQPPPILGHCLHDCTASTIEPPRFSTLIATLQLDYTGSHRPRESLVGLWHALHVCEALPVDMRAIPPRPKESIWSTVEVRPRNPRSSGRVLTHTTRITQPIRDSALAHPQGLDLGSPLSWPAYPPPALLESHGDHERLPMLPTRTR